MPINSRAKGARNELAWAHYLNQSLGVTARRGQQYSGSPDSPDIVCKELAGLHPEVKAVEKLNIHLAMAQAICDCGEKIPYVAHKKNRGEWLVTLRAQDLKAFSLLVSQHLHSIVQNNK